MKSADLAEAASHAICTYQLGEGICGTSDAAVRRYLPGWRCSAHTPAALAGHAEPAPDPARTLTGLRIAAGLPLDQLTPGTPTIVDDRALGSGKRAAGRHDHARAESMARAGHAQWREAARDRLWLLIRSGETFTADDVTAAVGMPPNGGVLGALFRDAKKAGALQLVDLGVSRRLDRHGGAQRVWRGAERFVRA